MGAGAGLVLVGLTISIGTGIFSGFAPALQASKLDPVVALRYEGFSILDFRFWIGLGRAIIQNLNS